MPDDVISKIKDRIDIVDLISSYLKLQKSGVNYKARCPFHNEKSASFFVSSERQIWHCFGCSRGGDAFGFVKEIEGMEFPEALRVLAARAGVKIDHFNVENTNQKTKLYEICELATRFFEKQLRNSSTGKKAMSYLLERGLEPYTIDKFRLGYAPDSWNALGDFLSKSFSDLEIFQAGLSVQRQAGPDYGSGRYYDRFRSRIIFPVSDINGQIVGFSGRVFGDSAINVDTGAKYINTPQTVIYDKSRILFGLNLAKMDIRQNNKCLVVEGNMDVIMSHQAGAKNVVAISGTALTTDHLKTIKRYTENLSLCLDADGAGAMATERSVGLALADGFNVEVVSIDDTEIKDPADYVKKYGFKWQELISRSRPFLEFLFEKARQQFDTSTALGKKMLVSKLMPFIATVASKTEQSHWLNEVSLVVRVKEEVLQQELAKTRPITADILPDIDVVDSAVSASSVKRLDLMEESLLAMILKLPSLGKKISQENTELFSAEFVNFVSKIDQFILKKDDKGEPMPIAMEFAYLISQEMWKDIPEKDIESEFNKVLDQVKRKSILVKLEKLEYDIKTAEKDQDKPLVARLTSEFSSVSRELASQTSSSNG